MNKNGQGTKIPKFKSAERRDIEVGERVRKRETGRSIERVRNT